MGWEMSVGFGLSNNLQRWDGKKWDMQGSQEWSPPVPDPVYSNSRPSNGSTANGASAPADSSSNGKAEDTTQDKGPPLDGMSGSIAQAMLECHYSFNNAFLEDKPLLDEKVSNNLAADCMWLTARLTTCAILGFAPFLSPTG